MGGGDGFPADNVKGGDAYDCVVQAPKTNKSVSTGRR